LASRETPAADAGPPGRFHARDRRYQPGALPVLPPNVPRWAHGCDKGFSRSGTPEGLSMKGWRQGGPAACSPSPVLQAEPYLSRKTTQAQSKSDLDLQMRKLAPVAKPADFQVIVSGIGEQVQGQSNPPRCSRPRGRGSLLRHQTVHSCLRWWTASRPLRRAEARSRRPRENPTSSRFGPGGTVVPRPAPCATSGSAGQRSDGLGMGRACRKRDRKAKVSMRGGQRRCDRGTGKQPGRLRSRRAGRGRHQSAGVERVMASSLPPG